MASNSRKESKTARPAAGKGSPVRSGPKTGFFRRNRFAVVLFSLVFLVYGNSIFNGYALDDEFYTAGANKFTQKGLKGIPEIFRSRTFYNNDGTGYSYRPMALTSFAIEIQLFGEKPKTSHFINVLLYAFTMVLLFGLLRKWFHTQGDWFTFFVCLVFLVHPLHTEVVANIKCRDELLAFFFGVLMLRSIWKHVETKAWWCWPAIAICFALAMLSKTTVAPLIILGPFAVWYFTDRKWWSGIVYVLPVIAIILVMKVLLFSKLPEMSRTLQGFENPIADMSGKQLSATAAYVMGRYLFLHFIPYPLVFYYGLNEVPICSWSDPLVILSVLVYVALAVWAWFEFRKKSLAGFGLIWFLGNIVLFSNLFGAAPGIMAERFTYIASLGFAIVLVDLVFRFQKFAPKSFDWKGESSRKTKWIFLTIAILFSLRSMVRNEAWEDKETLYRNDVALAPESAKINMLLASLLSSQAAQLNYESQQLEQQGQVAAGESKKREAYALFGEARGYYKQATDMYHDYYTAWSNLGTAYYFVKEYRTAIPYFLEAIAIKPDYAEAYFNLGMSYEQLGTKDSVIKGKVVRVVNNKALLDSSVYYFSMGLQKDPKYVNTAEQLSRVLFTHYEDSAAAMKVLNESAAKNPASDVPWNAMGNLYLQREDTLNAVRVLEKAAELNPNVPMRLRNLALYFQAHGDMTKASYYSGLFQKQQAEVAKRQKLLGIEQK
ncbi:MAG TPA: tetratricopeptide repeat protein [Bacteroidia bacterium]|nr:tetratricopeptide repeat protein [Bacteroidia bacterium]